jgi:hypothetical protein
MLAFGRNPTIEIAWRRHGLAAVLELEGRDNTGVIGWPQPRWQPVNRSAADERRFPDMERPARQDQVHSLG